MSVSLSGQFWLCILLVQFCFMFHLNILSIHICSLQNSVYKAKQKVNFRSTFQKSINLLYSTFNYTNWLAQCNILELDISCHKMFRKYNIQSEKNSSNFAHRWSCKAMVGSTFIYCFIIYIFFHPVQCTTLYPALACDHVSISSIALTYCSTHCQYYDMLYLRIGLEILELRL